MKVLNIFYFYAHILKAVTSQKPAITQHIIFFILFFWLINLLTIANSSAQQIRPKIQLATAYQVDIAIKDYWVSEKLDGVRGYWDGQQMLTRQGNIIQLPRSFTLNWPRHALDGELWIERQQFEKISALVRRQQTTEQEWQNVKFMLFDLPEHQGTFSERIMAMQQLIKHTDNPHLQMVTQQSISDKSALQALFSQVIAEGGEGLMLHKKNAYYQLGRSPNIMKLKPFDDAEAEVIGYIEGKGKYQQMLGSIKVKTKDGIVFKIGSGFSDKQRKSRPPIGSIITFKYSGKTAKGVPRFASFLRIRHLSKVE
ncbi:DNA ligase [Colwellia sp. MEBiC06753]